MSESEGKTSRLAAALARSGKGLTEPSERSATRAAVPMNGTIRKAAAPENGEAPSRSTDRHSGANDATSEVQGPASPKAHQRAGTPVAPPSPVVHTALTKRAAATGRARAATQPHKAPAKRPEHRLLHEAQPLPRYRRRWLWPAVLGGAVAALAVVAALVFRAASIAPPGPPAQVAQAPGIAQGVDTGTDAPDKADAAARPAAPETAPTTMALTEAAPRSATAPLSAPAMAPNSGAALSQAAAPETAATENAAPRVGVVVDAALPGRPETPEPPARTVPSAASAPETVAASEITAPAAPRVSPTRVTGVEQAAPEAAAASDGSVADAPEEPPATAVAVAPEPAVAVSPVPERGTLPGPTPPLPSAGPPAAVFDGPHSIVLHYNPAVAGAADEAARLADALTAAGAQSVLLSTTSLTISATHLRQYHAADAELGRAVASVTEGDVEIRDFTDFSPQPLPGLIEVWFLSN